MKSDLIISINTVLPISTYAVIGNGESMTGIVTSDTPGIKRSQLDLKSLISALNLANKFYKNRKLVIKTNSSCLHDAFHNNQLQHWKNRGWRTAAGKQVRDKELWLELCSLLEAREFTWKWEKITSPK